LSKARAGLVVERLRSLALLESERSRLDQGMYWMRIKKGRSEKIAAALPLARFKMSPPYRSLKKLQGYGQK
jgi:hypothetical protein